MVNLLGNNRKLVETEKEQRQFKAHVFLEAHYIKHYQVTPSPLAVSSQCATVTTIEKVTVSPNWTKHILKTKEKRSKSNIIQGILDNLNSL